MGFFKRLIKTLFSRFVITSFLIIIQITLLVLFMYYLNDFSRDIHMIFSVISILLVIVLINKNENSTYKIPWLVLILAFPVAGTIGYLMFGSVVLSKRHARKLQSVKDRLLNDMPKSYKAIRDLGTEDIEALGQTNYIYKNSQNILYNETNIEYLKSGEIMYERILEKLKEAKKYIFIEFFIIGQGKMWDGIHEILLEKVKEGLDVRVLYDDVGSIKVIKPNFRKELENEGIKTCIFNRYVPIASTVHNNRDHRKIIVIDGIIGFTGGVNISDEYINVKKRFGYWKDCGVMLEGIGVNNLTALFLRSWNSYYKYPDEHFLQFFPSEFPKFPNSGFNHMFGDGPFPLYSEHIGENVYLNIINQAKKFLYITTPYLIVDHNMINALRNASMRGVDVRIITPHKPDKKLIFWMTQSNYFQLVKSGVKIYEYTPGFIHSKLVLSDGTIGVSGTINFDYRSFVHHFECACWMYKTPCLNDIYQDFIDTMTQSQEITLKKCRTLNPIKFVFVMTLKFFAPLL